MQGQHIDLTYEFPETLGNMHLVRDTLTFVTRKGTMWRLNPEKRTARLICSVGRSVTHSYADPVSGNLLTQGIYHQSVHTQEGQALEPFYKPPDGTFASLPHVIPSHTGTYLSKLGGGIDTLGQFDKALVFIPHNTQEHLILTRFMMPYVRPALVKGGIMYASMDTVLMWNETTRCTTRIALPSSTRMMPRAIVTTGLGKPVVTTGTHLYVLTPQEPFQCVISCPLTATHSVFSAPYVLGELVIGYNVANPANRWVMDTTTGRKCTHPEMKSFHGVIHKNRCIAHVMGTGISVTT